MAGAYVSRFGGEVGVAINRGRPLRLSLERGRERPCLQLLGRCPGPARPPADDLNADIHASADYRAHLVKVMTKRAVEACG
jgi:carbon-monoxide dehydrogenase medium subunit